MRSSSRLLLTFSSATRYSHELQRPVAENNPGIAGIEQGSLVSCHASRLTGIALSTIVNRVVNNSATDTSAIFQALADPTRRTMIERLSSGPMPVSRLAEPFPISAPAVSKHVRVLEKAGLIRREIRGRSHVCHLQSEGLRSALTWLEQQRRFWE